MGDEGDELAVLFAAWRQDIDSVPAPAMVLVEAALILQANAPVLPAARSRRCQRFLIELLNRRSLSGGSRSRWLACPEPR